MLYLDEKLDQLIYDEGIVLEETHLPHVRGLYVRSSQMSQPVIAVSTTLPTTMHKNDTKAHELGHHFTTATDLITAPAAVRSRGEARARRWATEYLMSPNKLISLWEAGVKTPLEMVDLLQITPEEFIRGMELHESIHGPVLNRGQYEITFSPFKIRCDRRRRARTAANEESPLPRSS